jgi:cytochrome c5
MTIVRTQPPGLFRIASFAALLGMAALVPAANAADRTGKQVVEAFCIACHGTGVDGAPRIGNTAEWAPRAKEGLDRLPNSAMNGLRKMPAHGGQAALSDLEMTRAIAYMISGGTTPDPVKTYGTVSHGSGLQIVATRCGNCHLEGSNGAPKIGDIEAWRPRLQKGISALVSSAVHGHNKMPARGGFANLSDVDMRAAVSYMASRVTTPTK